MFYNESACDSLTAYSNGISECFQRFINFVSQEHGAHPIAFNNRCLRLRSMLKLMSALDAILYVIDNVTKNNRNGKGEMKSRYKTLFLG